MKFRNLLVLFIIALIIIPALAEDPGDQYNSAGALYSDSVDLANEGKYQQALDTADKALAMNVTSLTGLIQSNRAGILVMLDRNEEAISAADAALAVEGNLTTVHSIAWYNKGNALRALGRISEAKTAYDNAYALDKTLTPPFLPSSTTVTTPIPTLTLVVSQSPAPAEPVQAKPTTTKSPLSPAIAFGAILLVLACSRYLRSV